MYCIVCPFLTVKFKSSQRGWSLCFRLRMITSLSEGSTRGRRLAALGLRGSARSGFFPLKSQLLHKPKSAGEMKHTEARWPDVRVAEILLPHVRRSAPRTRGGAPGGWCIRDAQPGRARAAGAGAHGFQTSRLRVFTYKESAKLPAGSE